jgi:hypothetical protein
VVGVFAVGVLVGVEEELCSAVGVTVGEEDCGVAEDAEDSVELVDVVCCCGEEDVAAGGLDDVVLSCGAETETPWRGVSLSIRVVGETGDSGRTPVTDNSSSRLRRGPYKNMQRPNPVSTRPTTLRVERSRRERTRMLKGE